MFHNMINGINFFLDEEYPSVKNVKVNKKIAYKLKKIYAGVNSELSSIHKYIYQHLIIKDEFKEIKEMYQKIAITEMRHLETLGEIIKNSAINPTFTYINKKDNETYWSSDLIKYEDNILTMLQEDIKREKKAIKEYKEIIDEADNYELTNILNRIILDEEHHIKLFNSILENLI